MVDVTAINSTTVLDNFTGTGSTANDTTSGNDTVNTSSSADNTGDVWNGGAGTDTLNITNGGNVNLNVINVSNIEQVTSSAGTFAQTLSINSTQDNIFQSIDLGDGADVLSLVGAGAFDITSVTISNVETLNSGSANDNVTINAAQLDGFTTVNLGAGTGDILNVNVGPATDFSTATLATIGGAETVNILGTTGNDTLTITGAQANAFLATAPSKIDLGAGTADTLALTSTSTAINAASNTQLAGIEAISLAGAAAGVTLNLSSQSEGFTITGSAQNDTITGGAGADTLVLSGDWDDYTITETAGVFTITGPGGTDTVSGIESFQFANATFTAAQILNDAPVANDDNNLGNNDDIEADEVIEAGGEDNGTVGDASAVGNVLTNDTDADSGLGDSLTVTGIRTGPEAASGTLTALSGATIVAGTFGTLTINADGSYTYELDDGLLATQELDTDNPGSDVFTYQVTDEKGATSLATLTITITGANDAPVIDAGSSVTAGAVSETIGIAGIIGANPAGGLEPQAGMVTPAIADALATLNTALQSAGTNSIATAFDEAFLTVSSLADGQAEAFGILWDYLDDLYVVSGYNFNAVNEAFIRLGVEYANYLEEGGLPFYDVIVKFTADDPGDLDAAPERLQTIHDNLLGNLSQESMEGRLFPAALEAELIALVEGVNEALLTRPYYGGYDYETDTVARAFDVAQGYAPVASGQITFSDPDDTATASASEAAGDVTIIFNGNSSNPLPAGLDVEAILEAFDITADGQWTYDARGLDLQALADGDTLTLTYTVTVTDDDGAEATIPVTITINGTNDAPEGAPTASLVDGLEDEAYTVSAEDLLNGVTDPDNGDTLSVANLTASNGTVANNPDGTFTITPDDDFNGVMTLTYNVSDGTASIYGQSVTYVVEAAPDGDVVAYGATLNADSLTPAGFLFTGSGIPGNNMAVATDEVDAPGLEIGLRADMRFQGPAPFEGGVAGGTYVVAAGTAGGTLNDGAGASDNGWARWNYTFSINADTDDNGGTIGDYEFTFRILKDGVQIAEATLEAALFAAGFGALIPTINGGSIYQDSFNLESLLTGLFDPNAPGTYTIEIVARDRDNGSDILANSIDIVVNNAPVAANDTLEAVEDQPITFNAAQLIGNDSDANPVDDDDLVILDVTSGTGGSAMLDGDGNILFTPNADFNGVATFTYTLSDGREINFTSNTATVTVNVTAVNDAPVLGEIGPLTTDEETAITGIDVLSDASAGPDDESGQTLTVTSATAENGTVTIDALTGELTYTPNENYFGADTITYTVEDSGGMANGGEDTTTGEISVTVNSINDPVTGSPSTDLAAGTEDVAYTVTLAQLLAGFADADGDMLGISGLTASTGTVSGPVDGVYTITQALNANGPVTLTYTVTDGNGSSLAGQTLSYTLTPVNDAPVIPEGLLEDQEIGEDEAVTVTAAEIDAALAVLSLDVDNPNEDLAIDIVIVNELGMEVYSAAYTGVDLTFTPPLNYNGTLTATVTVTDPDGLEDSASFAITVNPANDPVTGSPSADLAAGTEDVAYTVTLAQLLAGFADADGDILSVSGLTASSGTVSGPVDGVYTITQALNANGPVTLTYTVTDGNGSSLAGQTLSYTLTPVNDAPVIPEGLLEDQEIGEDEAVTVTAAEIDAALAVLSLDVDNPNEDLAIDIVIVNELGMEVYSAAYTGVDLTFTPPLNYNGTLTATVTVTDPDGLEGSASFAITVNPVNDAPVSGGVDSASGTEDAALISGTVPAASDVDSATLTYALVAGSVLVNGVAAADGTVTFNANGSYSYAPGAGDQPLNGGDANTITFQYVANDGSVNSAPAAVTITVNGVNDAPVIPEGLLEDQEIDEDEMVTVTAVEIDAALAALSLDVDNPNEDLAISIVIVDEGGLEVHSAAYTGSDLTFTPPLNYTGTLTASVTVVDPGGGEGSASFAITVNPVDDAPVLADIANQEIDEEETVTLTAAEIESLIATYVTDADEGDSAYVLVSASDGFSYDSRGGDFTYTPDPDFNGTVTFTVTAYDDDGTASNVETFTLTVNPLNDDPEFDLEGSDLAPEGDEENEITGFVVATDVDEDDLTYEISSSGGPSSGTVTIDELSGEYTYVGNENFDGSDSFTVLVSDGNGGDDEVVVNVTVNGVNDAPVSGGNATINILEDAIVGGSVPAGSDVDGDALTYVLSGPAPGGLTWNGNGTFSFDAGNAAYAYLGDGDALALTVSYYVSDGSLNTSATPSTLTINISGQNETPGTWTAGDDTGSGTGFADTINALGGDDTVSSGGGNDIVNAGGGDDTVNAGSGDDTVRGGSGDDLLTGSSGLDKLFGDDGDDTLSGGSDNDELEGGAGADILNGGGGTDWAIYASSDAAVTVNLASNLGSGGHAEGDTFSGIENVRGSAFNDTLTGNNAANVLEGGAGNDTLNGLGGVDTLIGGQGNDFYYIDVANPDTVIELAGEGNGDRYLVNASYVLAAGLSIEVLSTDAFTATTAINLTGNELATTIIGNNGNNTIDGGAGGGDLLYGLAGNDTYLVDHATDQVAESAGGGSDRVIASVSYSLGNVGSVQEIEFLEAVAGTGAINLTGNASTQTITGNDGNNTLNSQGGGDTLIGGNGNDFYFVRTGDQVVETATGGNDRVFANSDYILSAGAHVEILSTADNSGSAAINLTGNELGNTIYGNGGVNVLAGMLGNDLLFGGGGADDFLFNTALNAATNLDRIADFVSGTDQIHLDDAIFANLINIGGTLDPGSFAIGAAADANDYIIYNAGRLFYDADGNGAGAAVQFAVLTGSPTLAATDFVVV